MIYQIKQLDVERYETEVIEGEINTIENEKPIIIVETKPDKYVENKLFEMGYEYYNTKVD